MILRCGVRTSIGCGLRRRFYYSITSIQINTNTKAASFEIRPFFKQPSDGSRRDYYYRALKLNAKNHRFFCIAKGEPGLGPHFVQPLDEIYVLAGC